MPSAILGFVAGACWLQNCASLPSRRLQAACALAALLLLALARAHTQAGARALELTRMAGGALAGVLLGYAWAALLAQAMLAAQLAPRDEGRDLALVGVVESLPYVFDGGVRFNFHVERTLSPGVTVPPHVALAWYAAQGGRVRAGAAAQPVPALQPGERWQFTVRLQRPHRNANRGGFDYEVWLLEQGLRATGYVRCGAAAPADADASTGASSGGRATPDENRRLDAFVPSFGVVVERARAILRARIMRAPAGADYACVIVALVIGDQRAIGQSDWQVFNRTGIGHLISI